MNRIKAKVQKDKGKNRKRVTNKKKAEFIIRPEECLKLIGPSGSMRLYYNEDTRYNHCRESGT